MGEIKAQKQLVVLTDFTTNDKRACFLQVIGSEFECKVTPAMMLFVELVELFRTRSLSANFCRGSSGLYILNLILVCAQLSHPPLHTQRFDREAMEGGLFPDTKYPDKEHEVFPGDQEHTRINTFVPSTPGGVM